MPPPEANAALLAKLRADAEDIFASALDSCSIERIVQERVTCAGNELRVEFPPWLGSEQASLCVPLDRFRSVLLIAIGKAAVPMTLGMLRILPDELRVRGICVAPARPALPSWPRGHRRIAWFAGGHPAPNRNSFRAADAALRLLQDADEHTLVLFLISGGGSSLFERPLDPMITLADTIAFHRTLVGSGATIAEINTLRKHFSAVKGGRLALAAKEATKLTLSVLDVPRAHLDVLASGPTVADTTTLADCRELLAHYRLLEQFPQAVRDFFAHVNLPETPDIKTNAEDATGSPLGINWHVPLLSSDDLLDAARRRAGELGYTVVIDNTCDDWTYDRAAHYLVDRLAALRSEQPDRKICLLSAGEVTVLLNRKPGKGGRNQQFALASARLLAGEFRGEAIVCLSAGSDGVDGNSPAAGGIVDPETWDRALARGFPPEQALADFDAYPLLDSVKSVVQGTPQGNNLRDLRVYLSVTTPI